MKNCSVLTEAVVALLFAACAFSASATEYWWTGNGGDGKWSTAANRATDDQGTPADAAPKRSEKADYHFDVPAGGLEVTVDSANGIIVSNLYVTTSATDPVELKIVSPAQGNEFDFTAAASITVGANATLVLNTDMGASWTSQNLPKYGEGTVVFDLAFRTPQTSRPLIVKEGRAVVLATSKDPRFLVRMDGSDPENPPVFENQLDNGLYGNVDSTGVGNFQLNGKTMNIGDASSNTAATNPIPAVADSGTLSFQNERAAILNNPSANYTLELDRADVLVPGIAPEVCWLFDDAADPKKDAVGQGSRFVTTGTGTPSIVTDGTRGSVLSLDGSFGFVAPDENNWLDGFAPKNGFTIAMWLKPSADTEQRSKIFFWGSSENGKCAALRTHDESSGTNLLFSVWGANYYIPVSNLRNGAWHHVAIVFNGRHNTSGNLLFYYDGVLVQKGNYWNTYDPDLKDFYIGNVAGSAWGSGSSPASPYKGLMDDFLVSSRVLTLADIARLWNDGLASRSADPEIGDLVAKSAGVLYVGVPGASVKTLSGTALQGGVELKESGSTLTVGAGAGDAATTFKGTIAGTDSTLAKAGADYTLTLDGVAKGVTNVAVDEGTLRLRRPTARRGLVCHYSFDDPTDFGHDDGPGGLNLAKGDSGTPTAVAGVRGNAVHFSGTDSPAYFDSGNNPRPVALPSGDTSFTVSLWIRPASTCDLKQPFFCWGKNASGECSQLRLNDARDGLVWNFFGGAYAVSGTASVDLTNGGWHHVVCTYDATTRDKKLYCDGAQIGATTIAASSVVNINPTYKLELARYSLSNDYKDKRYEGDMDEFMIFDYAWSADEVAAEYNGTAAPANVSVAATLPAPVARWTFDGDDPLADTTGSEALHLSAATTNDNYNVTFVTGDAICGKAAKFSGKTGSGYLKLDAFPSGVIPAGNSTFTAIARYRPDATQVKNGALCVVGWGTIDNMANGSLFRIGPYEQNNESARFVLRSTGVAAPGTYCSSYGNDRTRWYTVAVVYQPSANTTSAIYSFYVDGALIKSGAGSSYNITATDFAIGAAYNGGKAFTGLVDDIQIYNCALSEGQVRMVAEQFEASKGKATTGSEIPAGVFADQPDVTVAQGATLKVASVETLGNLSGAGSVEILPNSRLNIASSDGFTGAITGAGVAGFADGAELDLGDGSKPILDVDLAVVLGADVNITTTSRSGRILLARASSFVGAENLESWTASVPGNRRFRFLFGGNGMELYLIVSTGLSVHLR